MKRQLSHLERPAPPGRCLPLGQPSGFFFHTSSTVGLSPGLHMHLSARTDLEVKASGRSKTHYGLALPPEF